VGNDEYARSNGSFGLTTLRKRHVDIQGSQLRLRFRGKSGVQHDVTLADPRVARNVHPWVLQLIAGEPESRKTSAGATKRKAGLSAREQDFLALLAGRS
jgi:DNA topoisomerase IB